MKLKKQIQQIQQEKKSKSANPASVLCVGVAAAADVLACQLHVLGRTHCQAWVGQT
jgi:hypothetical protein